MWSPLCRETETQGRETPLERHERGLGRLERCATAAKVGFVGGDLALQPRVLGYRFCVREHHATRFYAAGPVCGFQRP